MSAVGIEDMVDRAEENFLKLKKERNRLGKKSTKNPSDKDMVAQKRNLERAVQLAAERWNKMIKRSLSNAVNELHDTVQDLLCLMSGPMQRFTKGKSPVLQKNIVSGKTSMTVRTCKDLESENKLMKNLLSEVEKLKQMEQHSACLQVYQKLLDGGFIASCSATRLLATMAGTNDRRLGSQVEKVVALKQLKVLEILQNLDDLIKQHCTEPETLDDLIAKKMTKNMLMSFRLAKLEMMNSLFLIKALQGKTWKQMWDEMQEDMVHWCNTNA